MTTQPAGPARLELLAKLRAALEKWDRLLAATPPAQLTVRRLSGNRSIADVVAHLMAWQQLSIARVAAALEGKAPEYPDWLGGADPFYADEHVNEFNARIYDRYRDEPWPRVQQAWRDGFLRFLQLAEQVPESDLEVEGRYAWLKGYPLSAVLEGAWEHHEEHYDKLPRLP